MEMHNLMEYEVKLNLDRLIEKKDVELNCSCKQCRMDIMAIALNSLPPKYVVSDKDLIYQRINNLNYQFNADVISALVKAIDIVNRNPRH